jgi:Fe-S-cluster containining protein
MMHSSRPQGARTPRRDRRRLNRSTTVERQGYQQRPRAQHTGGRVLARVGFSLGDERFEVEASVPDADAAPEDLLPAAYDLVAAVVSRGVERGGEPVSCRRGCGACCRQMVPISQAEARHLHHVVEAMPEPRRSVIRERFAAAAAQFARGDLATRVAHPLDLSDDGRQALAIDYFRLGIACPFLENEECSIYADRPLVCREYLVTTPAENCARPGFATVTRVGIGGRVSVAMGQLEATTPERGVWWMPLILALQWCAANLQEPAREDATQLLRSLVDWLKLTNGT